MNKSRIRFMTLLLCMCTLASWFDPARSAMILTLDDEEAGEGASALLGRPDRQLSGAGVSTLSRLGSAAPGSRIASGGPADNFAASTESGDQTFPAAISDGAGGMILVWEDFRDYADTGVDVYAHHVLACGSLDPAWPATGVPLTRASGDDRFPVLASDGAGGAYVVWNDDYPIAVNEDIVAHHLLADGTLDPAWPLNGLAVCNAPGRQVLAKITTDGSGGAFVAWDDNRAGRRAYVHHLVPGGLDPSWPSNGLPACPAVAAQQLFPVICSDGAGGAIVAWADSRTAGVTNRDIYAQRISGTGAFMWPAAGVPVCTAPGLQMMNGAGVLGVYILTSSDEQSNAIVADGAGGCVITWADARTFGATGDDVYAQRLTSTGAVATGWPANGVPLCTDPVLQLAPGLVSDGTGGAIGTWFDARPGAFAQHVSASGSVTGPPNGLLLGVVATTNFSPLAVGDGTGGALLAWNDARDFGTTDFDTYAQHVVTSPGFGLDPSWPSDGAPVSTAVGAQFIDGHGSMVSDGSGGFVAAWHDLRDVTVSGIDIYTQTVLASGNLPADPVATITGPTTGSVFPINTVVDFSGSFTDMDPDLHAATWEFDTLPPVAGIVNEAAHTVSGSHTFTEPGVYLVRLTVTDACGNSSTSSQVDGLDAMVVIYDPAAGFVTGGGWIASPAGAYVADPTLVGRANFGFVAKYLRGATVPTGNTEFQFRTADLNFSSTNYEWLVVAGARAQYKGSGTINGGGDYAFLLTAIDGNRLGGQPDRLRMKITDRSNDALVYDNQLNDPDSSDPTTSLGGGSVVIHKPNGMGPTEELRDPAIETMSIPLHFALSSGEPNPFRVETLVHFALPERSRVEVDLFDASGRRLANVVHGERDAGTHSVQVSGSDRSATRLPAGVYFLRMNARVIGGETQFAATRKLVVMP